MNEFDAALYSPFRTQISDVLYGFSREVVFISRQTGWTIEYLMKMPIKRYFMFSEILKEQIKEENNVNNNVGTGKSELFR